MSTHISERIKFRRKQLGFTQREVAEKLSVTDAAVHYWEKGHIPIKHIFELSKVLKCSQDWLLYSGDTLDLSMTKQPVSAID